MWVPTTIGSQCEHNRVLRLNQLTGVTARVVDAAREGLVIGAA